MRFKKPSGVEIDINPTEEALALANQLGWEALENVPVEPEETEEETEE